MADTVTPITQYLEALDIKNVPFGKEMRKKFLFDEEWAPLNHGSFGTYPAVVRSAFLEYQLASERRPDQFVRYDFPRHLDISRAALASYLNAPVETIVFVPNATTGINTVLRSLRFVPGDKILYFNFIYEACRKTINYVEETTPLEGINIPIDLPATEDDIVNALRKAIIEHGGGVFAKDQERKDGESRVRVALFDTIVSMPGVRLPFEKLVNLCKDLGVLSLVDGAHGVGHVPIDLGQLDPDFFVSNCHKWLYVPRGCAVFHVPLRNQHLITSSPTSHGFIPDVGTPFTPSSSDLTKSQWVSMFEFVGTVDSSPYLCVPSGLAFRKSIGEDKIFSYLKSSANRGATIIAESLGTDILDNAEGTLTDCALVNVRLPIGVDDAGRHISALEAEKGGDVFLVAQKQAFGVTEYLKITMVEEFNTFIAVLVYRGNWYARVSGQIYLEDEDFEFGAKVLKELIQRIKTGAAVY
ncbi:pyridoxal phosphate-dependent transferase [Peziza echinospora]|nr:pyridoxal phosphate-dependent transferase [Peziza echinospora]